MITFEEYLKGVENTPTINEEQEFLEEAYTPEMKQAFTASELAQIGKFLAQKHNISVQHSEFTPLPKKWKLSDLKQYQWCVFKDNDGDIIISELNYDDKHHIKFASYGVSNGAVIGATTKANAKFAFGMSVGEDANIRNLRNTRYFSQKINDKLTDVNNRVKALSPTSTVGKLRTIGKKYGFQLGTASITKSGEIYVSFERESKSYHVSTVYLQFTEGKWEVRTMSSSYQTIPIKDVQEFSETLANAEKLYNEVKDIDLSDLPNFS